MKSVRPLKSHQGFVPILVLIVLAAIGYILVSGNGRELFSKIGINLVNSTPQTPTYGWKTYLNSKYGFTLKYPTDWKVDLGVGGSSGDESKVDTTSNILIDGPTKYSVAILVQPTTKSLDEFITPTCSSRPGLYGECAQISSKENTVLGGVSAIKYRWKGGEANYSATIISAVNKGYGYNIQLNDYKTSSGDNIPAPKSVSDVFDNIAASFAFTK